MRELPAGDRIYAPSPHQCALRCPSNSRTLRAVMEGAWLQFIGAAEAIGVAAAPTARALTASFPGITAQLDKVATSVGQDGATVRYLLTLLLGYPLSLVFALLPPALKHVFSAVTGIVLAQFVFGVEWCHPLAAAAGTYLILLVTGVSRSTRSLRPALVFAWMMGYLTVLHLYRLHVDYMGERQVGGGCCVVAAVVTICIPRPPPFARVARQAGAWT
jgi:hypothetical protein